MLVFIAMCMPLSIFFLVNLALFYYMLGNVNPKLRSRLKVIQLIACVTYPNLEKYGFDKVLRPFIEDVNKLSKVILVCNI